ncbi:MAG: energy-coupling factor transporter transmembrane protein EcfT, partial [Clostridia bacterium]|nr:energy-coupling factor transporter transmembrane protein EcfT [Clostridia bacterium]
MSDISFGQYYPSNSLLHKADPRIKILLIFLILIFIFVANSWFGIAFMSMLIGTMALFSRVPIVMFLKNLKPVLPVLIIASLLNIFYVSEGTVLFDWKFITITTDGLLRAAFILVRIVLLIIVSGLLTYTTTPTQLTAAIERLLSPLKFIGLGEAVHTMAMMMTIALRFIPTLIEEAQKIIAAQKA